MLKKHIFYVRNLNEKGLSLIEIIISAVILAFTLMAFGYILVMGQGVVGSGGDRRIALGFAQETTEALSSKGFNWIETDLSNGASEYAWTQSGNVWSGTSATGNAAYARTIAVSYVNDTDYTASVSSSNSMKLSVTVSPGTDKPVDFKPVNFVMVLTRP